MWILDCTAVCMLRLGRPVVINASSGVGVLGVFAPSPRSLRVSFRSFVVHIGFLGWILVAEFWFREFWV